MLAIAFMFLGPPLLQQGLHYDVIAKDLSSVSALAFTEDGDLYATLEKTRGKGKLLRIRNGAAEMVLDGLSKPDGLVIRDKTFYLTNEVGDHAVLAYHDGLLNDIVGASSAEGIAAADGKLLVVEDKHGDGRLLRLDPVSGSVDVLANDLNEAEGVCEGPRGAIYFVEKSKKVLSRLQNGKVVTVTDGLKNPAYLNCMADGSVLITEDRTNFGRLLRYRDGKLEVVARNLRSPQTVVVGADGAYYLAEQRRDRILRIYGS